MQMPTYVVLYNFTDKGQNNIKTLADRMDEAKTQAEAHGIRVVGSYVTMGLYDVVVIVEAPNDEAVARGAAAILEVGNFRSITMRAFSTAEWRQATQS